MIDIVKVQNEGLDIVENVSVITSLIFELYDRLYIGGTITNSNEITFIQDTSDPKYIIGFAIKVVNPSEKKVKSAVERGDRTINYLSAKTGFAVRSKRPKIEKQIGNKLQTMDTLVIRDFDLDASKLSSLLTRKSSLNKRIAGYQSGMIALKDNDLERAVQGYYQVIENSGLKEEKQFKPLRHACSHHRIDGKDTAKAIRKFGIKCRRHKPVNFTDPDNWQQLYIHAHRLKEISDAYMRKILTRSNL